MNRRFEICQRAFVPVDANDGAFVFSSDGLKLVFDFGHDLYVDVIGIFVELKMQKSNLLSSLPRVVSHLIIDKKGKNH